MAEPKIRFKRDDGSSYPEWTKSRIGEHIEAYDEKVNNACRLPVLTSSKNDGIQFQNDHFGREQMHDITGYNVIPRGYCTYRNRSDGTDFTFNINNLVDRGIVSKFYPVFHAAPNSNLYFLMTLLNSEPKTIKKIAATAKGTGQKVLSYFDLQDIVINIPCLEEQQKIADFLSSVDEVIAVSEQEVANLETQKKAVMKKIFSQEVRFKREDGSEFPKWNDHHKLEDVSDFITKGATPTTYGFSWTDEGIPFFRNDAIRDNTFVYGDFSYISEEAHLMLSRSEVKGGDILIAITGEIGKVGMVPEVIKEGNINQHTARVRIIRDYIPYFVYQYLCSDTIQSDYKKIKTGLSMAQLSLEQIRNTEIPIVDYEEQRLIANFLSVFDEAIAAAKKELELWKELKKGLLQQMFV